MEVPGGLLCLRSPARKHTQVQVAGKGEVEGSRGAGAGKDEEEEGSIKVGKEGKGERAGWAHRQVGDPVHLKGSRPACGRESTASALHTRLRCKNPGPLENRHYKFEGRVVKTHKRTRSARPGNLLAGRGGELLPTITSASCRDGDYGVGTRGTDDARSTSVAIFTWEQWDPACFAAFT